MTFHDLLSDSGAVLFLFKKMHFSRHFLNTLLPQIVEPVTFFVTAVSQFLNVYLLIGVFYIIDYPITVVT